jgi:hypothetical protein
MKEKKISSILLPKEVEFLGLKKHSSKQRGDLFSMI